MTIIASKPLFEIADHDKHLRYRAGFTPLAFLLALSPIWLYWSVFAVVSLTSEAWHNFASGLSGVEIVLFPIVFYIALIMLGSLAVNVCSDTKLLITKTSLRLPWQFLFDAKFCIERPWDSLQKIEFTFNDRNVDDKLHPQSMILTYADGARIALALNGLSRADLKEFILSAQALAPQVCYQPPLDTLNLSLGASNQSLHASFTQMWEDELESRFGSTIFVPLSPGQALEYQSSGASKSLTIKGQLSFGGLSAVYLVSPSEDPGITYVLKEAVLPLSTDDMLKAKAQEMFERESVLLSSLQHSRIARVLDYFVSSGRHYILLEHIEGLDLRRFINEQGAQPPQVVLRWFKEGARILQYLHTLTPPLVHRDVTPDNLVLARDGALSLIDFGAANTLVGTATGTLVGKQAYIPPEQFRGKAICSSDIYALACTMYFALTGEEPDPLTELRPSRLVKLSGDLDQLIFDCTRQEASERVSTAQSLLERANKL